MSIRWRLTLWYGGLLALSLMAFAGMAYTVLARNLRVEIDASLQVRAQQVVQSAQVREVLFLDLIEFPRVSEIASPGVYIQIVTLEGKVARRSDNLGAQELPVDPDVMAEVLLGKPRYLTTTVENIPLRMYNYPLVYRGRVVGAVQVARSLAGVERTLGQLRAIFLIGMAAVLLLASAGGALLAAAGLRPIDEITRMARHIGRTEDLSQRLEYQGPQDEVGRLASTFNEMLERLDRAFQAQRRFVADASHALRTPLTAIRGNVELLLQRPDDSAAKETSLQAIQRETQRLSRVVSDLLLLAQADAGQTLDRQPVEMATLLLDVYQQARVMADGVTVSLGHEDQGLVEGDPDRLREMLLNLVDNALKHTPEGGKVTLSLYYNEPWIQISVADTGPGIPPEDLPHIFDRFYRVKSAKPRPGQPRGTGLGLAIAKWIVEQHGGYITVESQVGKGSTFTVWLPAAQM